MALAADRLAEVPTVLAQAKENLDRPPRVYVEIALDEDQVEQALKLLKAEKQTGNRRNGPYGADTFNVGIEVAKAAEENYPQEAIEIYQGYVETRIEWRGRENYARACQYLIDVRKLYNKVGHHELYGELPHTPSCKSGSTQPKQR